MYVLDGHACLKAMCFYWLWLNALSEWFAGLMYTPPPPCGCQQDSSWDQQIRGYPDIVRLSPPVAPVPRSWVAKRLILSPCDVISAYGDTGLRHHGFKLWFAAWQYQAMTQNKLIIEEFWQYSTHGAISPNMIVIQVFRVYIYMTISFFIVLNQISQLTTANFNLHCMISFDEQGYIWQFVFNGPLTRYVKLRVAHAPGMSGTFSPPPTSKETAS